MSPRTTLSILLLSALAVGCGRDSLPTGTVVYGRGGDAETLDPIHTSTGESAKVLDNVFDTLVTYADDSLEIVPSLAEQWEHSEDGLIWTFHLRPGVKFHDGTDLNADAVVFTFSRLLEHEDHPYVFHGVVQYAHHFEMIESVRAVDPSTVEFRLKHPHAVFLSNLTIFASNIVSPAGVKKHGKEFGTNPVGTGPFRFRSWNRGEQEISLEAFDEHWRGRPLSDRLIFVATAESAVRVAQLIRGEIHIADNLGAAQIESLAKRPEVVIQRRDGLNVCYLTMQSEKPPLDNPKVRRAISHAIDKQHLIEVAYEGEAIAAKTMVPPTVWGHHEQLQDREFNVEQARRLLEEASRESGFSLPLELSLFVMASPRPYIQNPIPTATLIKDSLAKIGIIATIEKDKVDTYFQRLTVGEHDLALSGWSNDNDDPDGILHALLHSETIGQHNLSRYNNPEVDRLLDEAQRVLDREQRVKLYHQAQELIFEDAPTVPLVHTPVSVALRKEIEGYHLHPAKWRLRKTHLKGAAE